MEGVYTPGGKRRLETEKKAFAEGRTAPYK